jgi:hypothetical protein
VNAEFGREFLERPKSAGIIGGGDGRALSSHPSDTNRRPESQARSVSAETPSNVANWDCDSWSRRRTLRSSLVPASGAARGISVRQHH